MKEIAWKKLTPEGFAKFGAYADMVQSQLGVVPVASFGVRRTGEGAR